MNEAAPAQFNVAGKAGKVNMAGGAGLTVIVEDPFKEFPQLSVPT